MVFVFADPLGVQGRKVSVAENEGCSQVGIFSHFHLFAN